MTSFRKVRDELLLSFCEEIINEDEVLLLYDVNKSKHPEYPYWNYERFTLQNRSEAECKTDFRFKKYDISLPWLRTLVYLMKLSVNNEQSVTVLKDYASFASGWPTLVTTATSKAFSADLSLKSP